MVHVHSREAQERRRERRLNKSIAKALTNMDRSRRPESRVRSRSGGRQRGTRDSFSRRSRSRDRGYRDIDRGRRSKSGRGREREGRRRSRSREPDDRGRGDSYPPRAPSRKGSGNYGSYGGRSVHGGCGLDERSSRRSQYNERNGDRSPHSTRGEEQPPLGKYRSQEMSLSPVRSYGNFTISKAAPLHSTAGKSAGAVPPIPSSSSALPSPPPTPSTFVQKTVAKPSSSQTSLAVAKTSLPRSKAPLPTRSNAVSAADEEAECSASHHGVPPIQFTAAKSAGAVPPLPSPSSAVPSSAPTPSTFVQKSVPNFSSSQPSLAVAKSSLPRSEAPLPARSNAVFAAVGEAECSASHHGVPPAPGDESAELALGAGATDDSQSSDAAPSTQNEKLAPSLMRAVPKQRPTSTSVAPLPLSRSVVSSGGVADEKKLDVRRQLVKPRGSVGRDAGSRDALSGVCATSNLTPPVGPNIASKPSAEATLNSGSSESLEQSTLPLEEPSGTQQVSSAKTPGKRKPMLPAEEFDWICAVKQLEHEIRFSRPDSSNTGIFRCTIAIPSLDLEVEGEGEGKNGAKRAAHEALLPSLRFDLPTLKYKNKKERKSEKTWLRWQEKKAEWRRIHRPRCTEKDAPRSIEEDALLTDDDKNDKESTRDGSDANRSLGDVAEDVWSLIL